MQHYRIFGYSLKYLPAICPYGRLFSLTGLLLHITVFLFSFPVLLYRPCAGVIYEGSRVVAGPSSGVQCCIVVMSVIDNHASCITTMRCPGSNHNVVRASSRKFGYHKYLSFFQGFTGRPVEKHRNIEK